MTPAAVPAPAPAPAAQAQIIRSIVVVGAERLESSTILSYIQMRPGQAYTQTAADAALKDLYATELFANVEIRHAAGEVTIQVQENPVVNRIILEGNKRIKNDKIFPEINLAPRQIFTRSKVRADVARIIELYKRQGRFAAIVEPKSVALPQNRVDIVYEISEGPKSKVRQINIIGNEVFGDGDLRSEMVTKQARFFRLFSSSTSYDPDRLAFDQQKLRQFYLTEGYADFRVVSAVAELTPDKRDFIITYVIEEGERYHFGPVTVESQLRDFDGEQLARNLQVREGDWYNATLVEDTREALIETAGTFGYAFADVTPRYTRDEEARTMSIRFVLNEAPRVYVEAVNVNGNTLTQDKVVRREFRSAEGDAFNSLAVKRSTARINSLGYFQENFEIEQIQGSAPDRIVLNANVQEQPTGELQFSAGFSSLESFILSGSIRQNNFRGRGQTVGASVNWSRYSRSVTLSFLEPYVFDRNFSAGLDIYRRDIDNWYPTNNQGTGRVSTFKQATTGFQLRAGVPLTEYMSLIGRYTLNNEDVTIAPSQYYTDNNNNNIRGDSPTDTCDPFRAGRYLCDAIGKRLSSIIGLSLVYNTLNSNVRPTAGTNFSVSGDFSGLGGSVKYARLRANAAKFFSFGSWIFSLRAEGGYIIGLGSAPGAGQDKVRLTDRFFLGDPQMRGFDIRGVGPRILREAYNFGTTDPVPPALVGTLLPRCADGTLNADCTTRGGYTFISDPNRTYDDPLGGKIYYLGRAELEIPLGTGARELGLRPSLFIDAGAVFRITPPSLIDTGPFQCVGVCDADGNPFYRDDKNTADPADDVVNIIGGENFDPLGRKDPGFREIFVGDSAKPRIVIGAGVNWNSPFGPFRVDFGHALTKVDGDETKRFTFNVGTQF